MGWWTEGEVDPELLIGDEPLDIAGAMIDKIANVYMEDVKRKPTPLEFARTLEIALLSRVESVLEGCENKELASITIKLKKRPKTQRIMPGDYFAVPLPSGGYGFGRIKRIFLRNVILGDFLAVRSDLKLRIAELSDKPVLFEAIFGHLSLADRTWSVLGNISVSEQDSGTKLLEKQELEEAMRRLQHFYGSGAVAKKLDEELQRRFPR